jgi:8-oxo-dGTP pyrophosphatase MutT (NUDIX family)
VLVCVAALIFDARERLFLVRRAPDRALFGGSWDVVGGHVEPGETPLAALHREVFEETGWQVSGVVAELPPWEWVGDDGNPRLEHDYVVTIAGDLAAPVLDAAEHTGFRWLAESELDLLNDDPSLIRQLADAAFFQRYPARVAPILDGAFTSAMRAVAGQGGRELVRRFGGDPARPLIDFRTALRWPGRWVNPRGVWRYVDQAACWAAVRASDLLVVGDEGFRAVPRGTEFLAELYALHDRVTAVRWAGLEPVVARTVEVLGRVLTEAASTAGDAFHAMAPPYEEGASPGTVLLNRMGTLRYHRADAHAAAWQAAGLTAAEIVAEPEGERRAAIEAETNRLAAPPFAVLAAAERATLLDDLTTLTGRPGG